MIPKTSILFLLVYLFSGILLAQEKEPRQLQEEDYEYLIESSRAIDPDRYTEVRGTPFRYKTFRPAVLYDVGVNQYALDSVNLNGFTHQFEFKWEGQWRELNPNSFLRGEIKDDDGVLHTYGRKINPRFPNKYAEIIYNGDFIVATMVYDVQNDEKIVQDVGKTLKLRRFSSKSLHFAMVDGDLIAVKTTPKNLAADLGHKAELSKFIKANKLKPHRREDLIKIYQKADELFD
ncbi:hypothetical protein [Lewinella sp. W8]|uniref:hypothetical protein n=1 Tax=Lewinella sp. W8 TaxID=2528208 RepID=UPI001068A69C|nr:hypothetical protein [Lewinella sp. W8]MTB49691.1 hypothetical protein [Lewinella sp. W8]